MRTSQLLHVIRRGVNGRDEDEEEEEAEEEEKEDRAESLWTPLESNQSPPQIDFRPRFKGLPRQAKTVMVTPSTSETLTLLLPWRRATQIFQRRYRFLENFLTGRNQKKKPKVEDIQKEKLTQRKCTHGAAAHPFLLLRLSSARG